MSSIPCNIVLIPDVNISEKVTSLSNQLKNRGVHFTLREGEYYPHLSLYMVQLDTDNMDEIEKLLAEISSGVLPISLTAEGYHQESGYIGVGYKNEAPLDWLQMKVIDAINPLRDGLRKKDEERLSVATGKERENIEAYGYRSVGELFSPHITITRFKEPLPIQLDGLPGIDSFDASFSKLGIFEMGENGTCVRKISEFQLGRL